MTKVFDFITQKLNNRFIRFLIIGGINTVFAYGLYALFIFLKFHYAVAVFFCTILTTVFNFNTTGRLVFKNRNNALIFRFIGVQAIIYIINTASLKVFNFFRVDLYLAGAALILPIAVCGFVLNKNLVFKG